MNNKVQYSPGQLSKLLQTLEDKGVTDVNLQEIGFKYGLIAVAAEAMAAGRPINREKVRRALGLPPPIQIVRVFQENDLLKPVATTTTLERTESLDEDLFFQTKEGLSVSDDFRKCFEPSFLITDFAAEQSYVGLELKRKAFDQGIRQALLKPYLSSLGDIATLIKMQWGGKSGILRTDSLGNIFYVEGKFGQVFVVKVYWPTNDCYWGVEGWEFDRGGFWDAGRQFLCPGTAKL